MIVDKYEVTVHGDLGKKLIATFTELATNPGEAEKIVYEYIRKSTLSIYSNNVPLSIHAKRFE